MLFAITAPFREKGDSKSPQAFGIPNIIKNNYSSENAQSEAESIKIVFELNQI